MRPQVLILNGDASASTQTYTLAADPTSLTSSNTATSSTVGLEWNSGGNPVGAQYNVEKSTVGGGTLFTAAMSSFTGTVKIVTGLLEGTSYWFRVRAFNGNNLYSAYTGEYTTATISDVPAAVTDLSALVGSAQITLTWTAPGDDGTEGAITGGKYDIRWSSVGPIANETDWNAVPQSYRAEFTTNTVYGDRHGRVATGLLNGVTYYFALKTQDETPGGWSLLNEHSAEFCARSVGQAL